MTQIALTTAMGIGGTCLLHDRVLFEASARYGKESDSLVLNQHSAIIQDGGGWRNSSKSRSSCVSPAPGHLAALRLPFTDHKANDLGVMPASNPEARARKQIDAILTAAGWVVQDRADFNPAASAGVAVREFPLKTGFADYLLLVDRKVVGVIEAKKEGTPLSGVESQSARYSDGLPDIPPAWRKPLPFLYESTGVESFLKYRHGMTYLKYETDTSEMYWMIHSKVGSTTLPTGIAQCLRLVPQTISLN